MKMKNTIKKLLSLLLAVICILMLAACNNTETPDSGNDDEKTETDGTQDGTQIEGIWKDATYLEDTVIGEGAKTILVEVKAEDKTVTLTVKTDKTTVGDALLEHGLIAGEESQYGLYVKVVNGMTADYDVDQIYWAFYINGEYAMSGVDSTNIVDGATYRLERTK